MVSYLISCQKALEDREKYREERRKEQRVRKIAGKRQGEIRRQKQKDVNKLVERR